ncbi:hypothetical protein Agub_g7698, partial [Astrephomene gubernaculifera]
MVSPSGLRDPHMHRAVAQLNTHLVPPLNRRLGLHAPRKDVAYCIRKVFWRCSCGRHLLFTCRKSLITRFKRCPETALHTLYCGGVAGGQLLSVTGGLIKHGRPPSELE